VKAFKKNKSPLAKYQFYIDTVNAEIIAGWAVNTDDVNAKPVIEVRSGDTVLWQTRAELERDDLAAAGFGNAAFSIYPDLMAIKQDIQQIDLYLDGHKMNAEPYDYQVQAPNVEQYQCFVDHIGESNISGWAQYQPVPGHKPKISVRSGDIILGEGRAEHSRQDLIEANIGDGHYAFDIPLNLRGLKVGANPCQVYLDGHLAPLAPLEIQVSAQNLNHTVLMNMISDELGQFEQLLANSTQQLHQQINENSQGQPASLNIVANVAINNIAQLLARMQVIETAMAKLIENKLG
jgi:hypothetical protein